MPVVVGGGEERLGDHWGRAVVQVPGIVVERQMMAAMMLRRRIVLPDVGGELFEGTAPLESFLLSVGMPIESGCDVEGLSGDDESAAVLDAVFDGAGTVGLLRLLIHDTPPITPVAPGGQRLEPLLLIDVPTEEVATLRNTVGILVAALARSGDPVVAAKLDALPAELGIRAPQMVGLAARFFHVCDTSWSTDHDLVAALLQRTCRAPRDCHPSAAEAVAAQRLGERLVTRWHDHETLGRWPHRHTGARDVAGRRGQ